MLPAGTLRELVIVETQTETRNTLGETSSTWSTFATRRASVEAVSYSESQRQNRIGAAATYTVRCRYVEGITGKMRIRWASRADKLLYVSSVVEQGHRESHELTCEEQAT